MKLAALTRLRTSTRRTYEAAATIRHRLARSEAEIEGWNDNDGNAWVWGVLGRGKDHGVTQASLATARATALREAEALNLEPEAIAAEIVLVNAVYDTAVDVLAALAAFQATGRGEPAEVAALVNRAPSAADVEREARFKLDMIDAAAAVRATLDAALTMTAEALGTQELDRDEAEEAIRAMVFEDAS